MKLILLIYTLFFIKYSQGKFNFHRRDENKYIKCFQAVLSYDLNRTKYNVLIMEDDSFLPNLKGLYYKTDDNNLHTLLLQLNVKPQSYTLFLKDVENFNETLQIISTSPVFKESSYIVIIDDDNKTQYIAETLWEFRFLRSKILVLNPERSYFKVYVLEVSECGEKVNSKSIFEFSDDLKCEEKTPSVDTTDILKNCPLYVIYSELPPYIIVTNNSVEGVFLELLYVFGEISQRPIVIRPFDSIYYEELQSFYFGTVQDDLEREYAHLFIGGMDLPTIELFDLTPIFTEDSLILLIPIPILNYWGFILEIVDFQQLAIFMGGLGLVGFVFYKIARAKENGKFSSPVELGCMFYAMCLGVGLGTRWPKHRALRLILGQYLLTSIIIVVFTQAIIFSILSGSIYGKPILSVEEYLKTDIPLKLVMGTPLLFKTLDEPGYHEMYDRHTILPNMIKITEAGDKALEDRNFATMVDLAYLLTKPNINKAFSHFELWTLRLSFVMKKHQYYHPKYYRWFATLIEAGFYEKYKNLYQSKAAWGYNVEPERRNFVLKLKHFYPAYLAVVCGHILSWIVFVLEILYSRFIRDVSGFN